jgi:hypothetical protein
MKDPTESFKTIAELVASYDRETTVAEYLRLRRATSVTATDSNRFFNFDVMLLLDEELRKHSIDPLLVAGVLDGNDLKLDELCLQIMESLQARRALEAQGRTQLQARDEAIPDSLIDFLIVFALEACEQVGLVPPASLVILVRERLGGSNPARFERYTVSQKRQTAVSLAMAHLDMGLDISIRRVAKEMGVQPSTVKRWFPDENFEDHVRSFKAACETVAAARKGIDSQKKKRNSSGRSRVS